MSDQLFYHWSTSDRSFRNFYPQYSLSAQFRLHDASAAGKYVKGARGVVRRAVTEIDETVCFS